MCQALCGSDITVHGPAPMPLPALVYFLESTGMSVHYHLLEQMALSLTKFNVHIKIRNATNWGHIEASPVSPSGSSCHLNLPVPTAELHLTTFYLESSFSVKYLNQN